MNSSVLRIGVAFLFGAIIGGVVGVLIFLRVLEGSSPPPSAPISAPTLSLEMMQSPSAAPDSSAPLATQVSALATHMAAISNSLADKESVHLLATEIADIKGQLGALATAQLAILNTDVVAAVVTATSTPTTTLRPTRTALPTATPTITPTPSLTAQPNQHLFRIVSEESEARYLVKEVWPPVTAIGRTNQIAGDIIVDFDSPPNSRVGTIRINLRTLRTDEPARDEMTRRFVLLSDRPEYEFTDFVPTAITGLPDQVNVGDEISFQITGDFTLRGITRSVVFEVTLILLSTAEIRGLARTVILREDYELLSEGLVEHGVAAEVTLEFEFVARSVTA